MAEQTAGVIEQEAGDIARTEEQQHLRQEARDLLLPITQELERIGTMTVLPQKMEKFRLSLDKYLEDEGSHSGIPDVASSLNVSVQEQTNSVKDLLQAVAKRVVKLATGKYESRALVNAGLKEVATNLVNVAEIGGVDEVIATAKEDLDLIVSLVVRSDVEEKASTVDFSWRSAATESAGVELTQLF